MTKTRTKKTKNEENQAIGCAEEEIRGGDARVQRNSSADEYHPDNTIHRPARTPAKKQVTRTGTLDRLPTIGAVGRTHTTREIFGSHVLFRLIERGETVKADETFYDRCWAYVWTTTRVGA